MSTESRIGCMMYGDLPNKPMVPTATRAPAERALPSGRRHIGQPLGGTGSGTPREQTYDGRQRERWARRR